MRFRLYECQFHHCSRTSTCHLVASTEEHASIIIDQHFEALGLKQVLYSLERVDHTLPEEWGGAELDEILENAPAGLVSYTEVGWFAHTAPVHKLRIFASHDFRGVPIFAAAPNVGVALALMANRYSPIKGPVHTYDIRDVTDTLPEDERKNLDEVLEAAQAGIAECDVEHDGWWVW